MAEGELVELTGLWLKTDKLGNQYMTGRVGSAQLFIFKNQHKKSENHPDYRALIGARSRDAERSGDSPPPEAVF